MPLIYAPYKSLIFIYISLLVILCIGSVNVLHRKIDSNTMLFSSGFFFLSFLSQRYFLIFVIITIPIFGELLSYFRKKAELTSSGSFKWKMLLLLIIVVSFSFFTLETIFAGNDNNVGYNMYPQRAVPFLRTLPVSENLLNEYKWGGYLIWQLPERKVFIDGRMPSWREDNQFVYGDYVKMMEPATDVKRILEKYNISIILLSEERKNQLIYGKLINLDWKIIYQDDVAMVLKKY